MKKAFTLIELLVVIAIIAILATILLPSLSQAKFLAQLTQCKSGLRSIGVSCALYANENDSKYPVGSFHNGPSKGPLAEFFGYHMLAEGVIEDAMMFFCPLSQWADPSWAYYRYTYPRGEFLRMGGQGWVGQSYLYFGNYSWDVKFHGINALFSAQEVSEILAGRLYPRDNTCARTKLFQDCVSSHYFDKTNHESPNSLFSDGSVEQGPEDPYDLPIHYRANGVQYWW